MTRLRRWAARPHNSFLRSAAARLKSHAVWGRRRACCAITRADELNSSGNRHNNKHMIVDRVANIWQPWPAKRRDDARYHIAVVDDEHRAASLLVQRRHHSLDV